MRNLRKTVCDVLADGPLTATEIAQKVNVDLQVLKNNLPHIIKNGLITKSMCETLGEVAYSVTGAGIRYKSGQKPKTTALKELAEAGGNGEQLMKDKMPGVTTPAFLCVVCKQRRRCF